MGVFKNEIMNKYYYAECQQDFWPEIKSIMAKSYNDAVEKLTNKYAMELNDDSIFNTDNYNDLREFLNENYTIALSDLEILEEL